MPYPSQKSPYSGRYAYTSTRQSRPSPVKPPERPRKGRKFIVLAALVLFVMTGMHITATRHASAHALAVQQAEQQALAARSARLANFDGAINQIISNNPTIDFSVAIQEIDAAHASDLRVFGDGSPWDAASTGKLITAADLLHDVADKKITLQHQIDGSSVQLLLQAMIVNSDDTAWEELNDYLGHDNLASYATSIGVTNYDVADNQLTATDISLVLDKLYTGKLLPNSETDLLLSYLKQANYRNFIVPAVPAGDTVYHKIGIDNDVVNDAAIVTHGDQSLVIVVFTNGNGVYDWQNRAVMMQQIAKAAMSAYFL